MKSATSMAAAYGIDGSSPEATWALAAEGVARVRTANMQAALSSFADVRCRDVLLAAWHDPSNLRWSEYVEVFERTAEAYSKVHGTLGNMPGIEYQTLLSRGAPGAAELFKSLRAISPRRIPFVPWHRILGAQLLRKN